MGNNFRCYGPHGYATITDEPENIPGEFIAEIYKYAEKFSHRKINASVGTTDPEVISKCPPNVTLFKAFHTECNHNDHDDNDVQSATSSSDTDSSCSSVPPGVPSVKVSHKVNDESDSSDSDY